MKLMTAERGALDMRESIMSDAQERKFAGHFSPKSVCNKLAQYYSTTSWTV